MDRFFLFLVFLFYNFTYSQVGINTTSPSPASVLEIKSSNNGVNFGGFMIPRVTLVERNAIPVTATDNGLMVFLQEGNARCVQIYNGVDSQWENVYCMPVNQAPVANNVTFSGLLEDGETLTASFAYSDAEGDPAGTHIYNWYRADDASGTNQILLQSGSSNTYVLTASEVNSYIAVEITPVATTGTSPGTAVLSTYQGPVLTPSPGGIFFSEIADPNNNASARFVELYNGSANPIDVSGWQVLIYFNANSSPGGTYTFPLGTVIAGNSTFIIAQDNAVFTSVYGFAPDVALAIFNSNGDDNFELRDDTNTLIDVYGIPGMDGTGTCSEFEDGRALRVSTVIQGNATWNEAEWIVWADSTVSGCTNHTNSPRNAPADFSPGSHPN